MRYLTAFFVFLNTLFIFIQCYFSEKNQQRQPITDLSAWLVCLNDSSAWDPKYAFNPINACYLQPHHWTHCICFRGQKKHLHLCDSFACFLSWRTWGHLPKLCQRNLENYYASDLASARSFEERRPVAELFFFELIFLRAFFWMLKQQIEQNPGPERFCIDYVEKQFQFVGSFSFWWSNLVWYRMILIFVVRRSQERFCMFSQALSTCAESECRLTVPCLGQEHYASNEQGASPTCFTELSQVQVASIINFWFLQSGSLPVLSRINTPLVGVLTPVTHF